MSGCPVCGGHEVTRDEVLDPGVLRFDSGARPVDAGVARLDVGTLAPDAEVLLLAACMRCDHRWTARPLRALAGPVSSAGAKVAAAA